MSEQILEQYGNVTIYTESNHPSPIYHVEGSVAPIHTATLRFSSKMTIWKSHVQWWTQCVVAHKSTACVEQTFD